MLTRQMGVSCFWPSSFWWFQHAIHFPHLLHREPAHDSKVLVGWSNDDDTIVLAFRGTSSMANVKSDLQVSMSLTILACHVEPSRLLSVLIEGQCPCMLSCTWLAMS